MDNEPRHGNTNETGEGIRDYPSARHSSLALKAIVRNGRFP